MKLSRIADKQMEILGKEYAIELIEEKINWYKESNGDSIIIHSMEFLRNLLNDDVEQEKKGMFKNE